MLLLYKERSQELKESRLEMNQGSSLEVFRLSSGKTGRDWGCAGAARRRRAQGHPLHTRAHTPTRSCGRSDIQTDRQRNARPMK